MNRWLTVMGRGRHGTAIPVTPALPGALPLTGAHPSFREMKLPMGAEISEAMTGHFTMRR
jgi:hypothetical protein